MFRASFDFLEMLPATYYIVISIFWPDKSSKRDAKQSVPSFSVSI